MKLLCIYQSILNASIYGLDIQSCLIRWIYVSLKRDSLNSTQKRFIFKQIKTVWIDLGHKMKASGMWAYAIAG